MPATLGTYVNAEPFDGSRTASVFLIFVGIMAIAIFAGALLKTLSSHPEK